MTRPVRNLVIWLIVAFLSVWLAAAGLLLYYFHSSGTLTERRTVLIPPGTSLEDISRILAEKQVIRFPLLFKLTTHIYRGEKTLKAGEYLFTANISPRQIVDMMIAGKSVIHRLLIPEGFTTRQVIDILNAEPVLIGEITMPVEEGTILPDTYFYTYGDHRQQLLDRMQARMRETVAELWKKRQPGLPLETIEEAIVLASMVEKETGVKGERAKVAGVFINRLNKRMRLQSDPTVIYAITNGERDLGRLLTRSDLQVPSPYNTYVVYGLPPKPIANPGKAALEAAMNPAKTDALYFVADGTGGHRFAATLEEHNRNVQAYRALMRQ